MAHLQRDVDELMLKWLRARFYCTGTKSARNGGNQGVVRKRNALTRKDVEEIPAVWIGYYVHETVDCKCSEFGVAAPPRSHEKKDWMTWCVPLREKVALWIIGAE